MYSQGGAGAIFTFHGSGLGGEEGITGQGVQVLSTLPQSHVCQGGVSCLCCSQVCCIRGRGN